MFDAASASATTGRQDDSMGTEEKSQEMPSNAMRGPSIAEDKEEAEDEETKSTWETNEEVDASVDGGTQESLPDDTESGNVELMDALDDDGFAVSLHGSLADADQLRQEHSADLMQLNDECSVAKANDKEEEEKPAKR